MPLRKYHRAVPLGMLLVVSACGGAAGDEPSGEANALQDRPGAAPERTDRSIDAATTVTLERTACFGFCPMYSLRVSGDGSVVYRGERYVKVVGEASSRVPVSEVQRLVNAMLDADYFRLRVPIDCTSITTDAPTVTTSLAWGGQTRAIEHYHGNPCVPAVLTELENTIDQIAGSAQWLTCDTPSGYCSGVR